MKFILFFLMINILSFAQNTTRRDSLQGGLRPERTCFDVQHYDLNINIDIDKKHIVGYNEITFNIVEKTNKIQIDLFENMKVDSIIFRNKKLNFIRDERAVFITFYDELQIGNQEKIRFYYSGNPIIAKNAPWDGGFVFAKDNNKKPWVGVACQGTGASLWFPCKDSQSDEPDLGATIKVSVPNGLMNVSNGRFLGSEDLKNGFTSWYWQVKNPINSYDITINIADYVHFGENYKSLDLDYYVLRENEAKARKHFEEVKPMMDCFQSKFGEYPFKNDGYKLVETPYLGMEHQSAVAYGNQYKKGYLGSDLSDSGLGMLFDFIIIHESGHEWFGNSITSKDIADMWIHEGFTCYTETVYLECQFGYEKSQKYINGLKENVRNDAPIIGIYGVNQEGSGDMYYKGALMLNTIRSVINDDIKWWKILLKYSETFRHKIIDTQTVIAFFNQETGLNLSSIFNQYLKYKNIPTLEMKIEKGYLLCRWISDEPNFEMPIEIKIKNKIAILKIQNNWTNSNIRISNLNEIEVLSDRFFINVN